MLPSASGIQAARRLGSENCRAEPLDQVLLPREKHGLVPYEAGSSCPVVELIANLYEELKAHDHEAVTVRSVALLPCPRLHADRAGLQVDSVIEREIEKRGNARRLRGGTASHRKGICGIARRSYRRASR